jgi:ABC-2 type transport system ATP-binding protein
MGGVYGFLGPNGAGKTTAIRLLTALMAPTRGACLLFGERVAPGADCLQRVGALVERPAFYGYLSPIDNLKLLGELRGLPSHSIGKRVGECLDRVGLAENGRRPVSGFSTGMRQRLGIASALLHRPDLVILDEPTNGLDPGGVVDVRRLIREIADDGATVFLSSHLLPEVDQLCDRLAILDHGQIIAAGDTAMIGHGVDRVFVGFVTPGDATRARPVLQRLSLNGIVDDSASERCPIGLTLQATAGERLGIAHALADAGVYPAELAFPRRSLESIFLELTGKPPNTAGLAT